MKKLKPFNHKKTFLFCILAVLLASVAFGLTSLFAAENDLALAKPVNQNAPDERPPSMTENVQVMVELSDVPAAVPYAEAIKAARAKAEAERTAALANPKSPASQATLKNPKKIQISAADNDR